MTLKPPGTMKALGEAASLGLMLAFCIFAGTALGVLLDRWLGTKPLLTLLLMVLGIVAGFYNVFRMYQNILRQQRSERDK